MEGDSLAKLAADIRAGFEAAPDSTPWPYVSEIEPWAARLDNLRERVLACQTDEYETLDKEVRSIAGAVSVGETTPREET